MANPTDPLDPLNLPPIDLQITISEVKAKPRKLKSKWTSEAVRDFRDAWGMHRQNTPLQDLAEGLDADNFEEWFEEWKKSRQNPDEALIGSMAQEMADEIDREIMATLAPPEDSQAAKIGSTLRKAIDLAQQGRVSPDLHDEIMEVLREPEGKEESVVDRGILYAPRIPCPTKPSFWPSGAQVSRFGPPADDADTSSKAPTAGEPAE